MKLPVEEFFRISLKTKIPEARRDLADSTVEAWNATVGKHELEFIQTLDTGNDFAGLSTYVFDKGRFIAGYLKTKEQFNKLNSKVVRDLISNYFNGITSDLLRKVSIEDENFNQLRIDAEGKLNIIYFNSVARDSLWIYELSRYLKFI